MTILYGRPDDPATFDRYYREVHIPLAQEMRGLTGWTLTWTDVQNGEFAGPVHLVVDLYAESKAAMDEVLVLRGGAGRVRRRPEVRDRGVTFLEGIEEEVPTA